MVSAFCVCINPTQSQFFYSHYTPLTTQFAPIFPQPFLPAPRVSSFPVVSPLVYNLPQSGQGKAASTSTSTVTYNLQPTQNSEYLGFGYRTDFKDGASSTVFYVTGPESTNLKSFRDFPNFSRQVQESGAKARNLASDIIDINAVPDAPGKIQSILQPSEFQKLFDNPLPGVINFYTFPAGTVPLPRQSFNESENATTPSSVSTTTAATTTAQEAIAAESIVNTRILKNDIESTEKSNQITEEGTTSSTTNTTTSTEAPDDNTEAKPTENTTNENPGTVSEDIKEETTTASTTEEPTTLETTTQV
ncbi:hypothetical protein BDFB_000243 [Asbolus verrucosus]|uniref:Uncharacterized protein n=1 Tax=Asbolus verrucosus TaxID=1661398 RepID=A0A482VW38_ASBVE|nr:hypothetical protein BDFB_000243 [Asbolus verrucosus]